jgi:hypothetical protein
MAYTLTYSPDSEDFTEAQVTMQIPPYVNPTEFVEFVQRFMVATGFIMDSEEELRLVKREKGYTSWGNNFQFGDSLFEQHIYCAAESAVIPGNAGEDTIQLF